MRVAIEARAVAAKGGGVKRYTEQLLKHLQLLPNGDEYITVTDKPRHGLLLPWWLQRHMPRVMRELKPDVVHFTKADVPKRKIAPYVVTIFDIIPLLFPSGQSLLRRLYWPRALRRAATVSDHIMTISEASKRDMVRRLGVPECKITVTPLAVDTDYFKPSSRSTDEESNPYVLFIGTLEPRKNVPLLIRAFARIAGDVPHQLIIAGRRESDYGNVEREIEKQKLGSRVESLDFVADSDLPALYGGADLFVWPSIYEGWGFPPQEAMACGTPVIVSNGGALPEVVGGAGGIVPFSANNLSDRTRDTVFEELLATEMLAVLTNENKQREMREAGLAQVKQFSWQDVAQKTAAVYKQVL